MKSESYFNRIYRIKKYHLSIKQQLLFLEEGYNTSLLEKVLEYNSRFTPEEITVFFKTRKKNTKKGSMSNYKNKGFEEWRNNLTKK